MPKLFSYVNMTDLLQLFCRTHIRVLEVLSDIKASSHAMTGVGGVGKYGP